MPNDRDSRGNWDKRWLLSFGKEISALQQRALIAAQYAEDPAIRSKAVSVENVLRVAEFLTRVEPNDAVTYNPEKYIVNKLNLAVHDFGIIATIHRE
jgi:hypothetical protein